MKQVRIRVRTKKADTTDPDSPTTNRKITKLWFS